MNQNNIIKSIVPVLAVIVLIESVVLISKLNNKNVVNLPVQIKDENLVTTTDKKMGDEMFAVNIQSDKSTLKVGEQATVSVLITGKEQKSIDALDMYLKYDPNILTVTGMTFDKKLPKPVFSKVSTAKSLLVANFLISNPEGLKLGANEPLTVMTFKVKAIKAGVNNFEISTGNVSKESATMIVENATSKPLTYSSNQLSINVAE